MKKSIGVLCSKNLCKSDVLFLEDISNSGFDVVLLMDCSVPKSFFSRLKEVIKKKVFMGC